MPGNVPKHQTASEIDATAADWAARADRGLTPAEDAELDAWLGEDPRRAGAYARARAVSAYSERAAALGPAYDPRRFEGRKKIVTRREWLMGGGAVAAGLGAAAWVGLSMTGRGQAHLTHVGEMKVVPLDDGSVISLNTHSHIRVAYSHNRRAIHLDDGEALFDVVKDAARPFVVLAGETEITAVGTSFVVRRLAGLPVQVLVREGIVDVRQTAQPVATTLRLPAMNRAEASDSGPIRRLAVAPTEVERAMAWREGRIAFEGDTLRQAAAEFARYSDTRIVIEDPQIARETVTGLFQANDPVGFSKAVAVSFGLRTQIREKQVRLYR
ncbi:fecR family protein [Asticcacaulis biprosthecium C19]|uniref:FecR family protein n=1 Tax=Asticcacaulis biprosthecium C19 TaxID=715226 RepID=F4QPB8_9CAUL|nr:fecR family protein [Asticcacaulis biprosthecium C19]